MSETTLKELGINKGIDLREKQVELMIAYNPIAYTFFINCGLGIGQSRHGEIGSDERVGQKGISVSETFRAVVAKNDFKVKIRSISQELASRMER